MSRFRKSVPDWKRNEAYKLGHYYGHGHSCWYLVARGARSAMKANYVADELRHTWVKVEDIPESVDWSPRITKARVTILIELGFAYAVATHLPMKGVMLDIGL